MKTIPFTQWDQIVRSIIDSLRCSVTSVEEDVEKSQKHRRQEKKRPVSAPPRNRNIAMNNQIEGQNLIADLNQNNESAKQEVEKILNDWNDDSVSTDGSPESTTPMKMISSTNNNAKARSHRAEILADKRHWKKTHSKEDNSALSSIASFRLRQYIERPFTPSNESIGFQSKPSQTVPMKKVSPKDSKILSSGSSSLDIADAFLQSTLGKDLTQNYYPVYSEIVEETEKLEKNVESQPNKKPNDEFYQSYYSQNWKSKKGGWVGDFGPHHTHPLSARNSNDDNENGIRKKF